MRAPHGLDPLVRQSDEGDIGDTGTGLPFRSEPIYGVVHTRTGAELTNLYI